MAVRDDDIFGEILETTSAFFVKTDNPLAPFQPLNTKYSKTSDIKLGRLEQLKIDGLEAIKSKDDAIDISLLSDISVRSCRITQVIMATKLWLDKELNSIDVIPENESSWEIINNRLDYSTLVQLLSLLQYFAEESPALLEMCFGSTKDIIKRVEILWHLTQYGQTKSSYGVWDSFGLDAREKWYEAKGQHLESAIKRTYAGEDLFKIFKDKCYAGMDFGAMISKARGWFVSNDGAELKKIIEGIIDYDIADPNNIAVTVIKSSTVMGSR